MRQIVHSDKNVVIGANALENADASSDGLHECVAIGYLAFAGTTDTTSAPLGTVAIGSKALSALTSGAGNTAAGFESLKTENDGVRNTAIGYKALTTLNTSAGNGETTAIGFEAGMDVSTGIANTFVGSRAGNQGTNDITTGSNNTMIGKEARGSANSASNQTVIGASAIGVADNSVTLGNTATTQVYVAPHASNGGATQQLVFRDDADKGIINYDHNNGQFRITVEGTEHTQFGSDGDIRLLHGGINFLDAEGTSASSDANTLDDYEEGDWTPVLSDGTNNATMSSSYNTASYIKVGKVVTIQGRIATTSLGSVSGAIRLTGLPFTVASGSRHGAIAVSEFDGGAFTAGHSVAATCIKDSTSIYLKLFDATTGTTPMQHSEWTADGAIIFGGSYIAE